MSTSKLFAASLLGLLTLGAGDLAAQQEPGEDLFTIAVQGGGYFPIEDLQTEGRLVVFEETPTLGGTATFWILRNVGVRANVLWAEPEVITNDPDDPEAVLAGEDLTLWNYSGDLLFRLPLENNGVHWYPYVLGGLGAVSYDFDSFDTETNFAGNVGVGLEVRLGESGRWGINGEVRDFISTFDDFGFDETMHDITLTGGVSVSF